MEAHLQALIAYFTVHANVALAAVFAAAALEAFALIGTIIPGSSIVFVGGVLIGLDVLDPWWTVAASMAGAVLGDGFSYWLGRRYRERLLTIWPVKNYRALFERGRAYFAVNGGKSVFFGRFLGPVRAIVPVVAGMSGMPAVMFYWMNVASALAWSLAHLVPGVLFGASLQIAGAVSSRLVIVIFVFSAVGWLLQHLLRLLFRHGLRYVRALRDRIVSHAQRSQGPVARLALSLFDPARPESGSLFIAALLLIAGGWIFLWIVEDVISNAPLMQFDSSFATLLQSMRTEWLDRVMVAIGYLGGPVTALALTGTISLYLASRRYWRTLGYWLAAAGFAELLVWFLRQSLGRPRPHGLSAGAVPFSFPSGHVTFSVVVYGLLAFLLANGKSVRYKLIVTTVASAAILLISFSRLYLGTYWLSDVLGSLSLGLFWVALLSIAHMNHVRGESLPTAPVALVLILTLGAAVFFHPGAGAADDVASYTNRPVAAAALLPDWEAGGWGRLPAARSDADGDWKEPFTVQWAGTDSELARSLAAAGWQAPEPWGLKPLLSWLLPRTPIAQLPVLSKLDHGLEQKITCVRVLNPRERAVLRLWPTAYLVRPGAAGAPRPLWAGILSIERLRRLPGLATIARTESDFARPVEELRKSLQPGHYSARLRERPGPDVLLVW